MDRREFFDRYAKGCEAGYRGDLGERLRRAGQWKKTGCRRSN
jgi:hypothetical protein